MNNIVLALTVHQPYASLLAWQWKEYETRDWFTPYRGKLVIHAGKNTEESLEDFFDWWRMFYKNYWYKGWPLLPVDQRWAHYGRTERGGREFETYTVDGMFDTGHTKFSTAFPLGVGLAICDLVDCIKMDDRFIGSLSDRERALGFYEPGRYAWKLANVKMFDAPIKAKGKQKLWTWS